MNILTIIFIIALVIVLYLLIKIMIYQIVSNEIEKLEFTIDFNKMIFSKQFKELIKETIKNEMIQIVKENDKEDVKNAE